VDASLIETIRREGPIPFSAFMEHALYGQRGFFAAGRGAGRSGRDFVTSPEVGALFGALVARALDRWWEAMGAPDPFVVVDAGAGRGRLAADVLRADPACAATLRYVMVERSEGLRSEQRELVRVEPAQDVLGPAFAGSGDDDRPRPVPGTGPISTSLDELPAGPCNGVVLANELLDDLPFDIVERGEDRWREIRVGWDGHSFTEVALAAAPALCAEADRVAAGSAMRLGARLAIPQAIATWLESVADMLEHGYLAIVDYAASSAELAARGQSGWLRTYRGHGRGVAPLVAPGEQDITSDVPTEYLIDHAEHTGFTVDAHTTQSEWLRGLGIDELVEAARAEWDANASAGDLAALAARSRVGEAAALTDPAGLGAHHVFVFSR